MLVDDTHIVVTDEVEHLPVVAVLQHHMRTIDEMPQLLLDELELAIDVIVTDTQLLEDEDDLVGYVVEMVELDSEVLNEMLIILEVEAEGTDIFVVVEMVETDTLEEMVDVVIVEPEVLDDVPHMVIDEDDEIVLGEMVELDEHLEGALVINIDVNDEMVEIQCMEMVELEVVDDNEIVNDERGDIDEMFQVGNID